MENEDISFTDQTELRLRAEHILQNPDEEISIPRDHRNIECLINELHIHQVELKLQNEDLRKVHNDVNISLERYVSLYEFAPTAYFTLDSIGNIQQVNLTGTTLLGVPRSRLQNARFGLFVSPECRLAFSDFLAGTFKSHVKETCEVNLQTESGDTLCVRMDAIVSKNDDYCLISLVDITNSKQSEQALRESEFRYRNLFDFATDGIFIMSLVGKLLEVNELFASMHGYSIAEMRGMSLSDLNADENAPSLTEWANRLYSGETLRLVVEHRHKDGHSFPLEASISQIDAGKVFCIQCFCRDITERRQMNLDLANRQKELEVLHRLSEIALSKSSLRSATQEIAQLLADTLDFPIVAIERYNETRQEMEFIASTGIPVPTDSAALKIPIAQTLSGVVAVSGQVLVETQASSRSEYSFEMLRPLGVQTFICVPMLADSRVAGVLSLGSPESITPDERILSLTVILANFIATIIDNKQAEEALRLSLEEKITLLKEIHHRVKNNLQIVASLLDLQAGRAQGRETSDTLRDFESRILSMALLHEAMYRSNDFTRIDFAAYMEELCAHLMRSLGTASGRARLEQKVDCIGIPMDQAVLCGLIVSELVSNALKHAFPGDRLGKILVDLHMPDERTIVLRVSDDGVGMPAGFDIADISTLGLRLIANLTRQLGGQYVIEKPEAGGTVIQVTFSLAH